MEKTRKIKFIISFALAAVIFAALPAVANAASLYFSPASGSINVGETFNVNVYVSSVDQAMNAASGVISFPADRLEITALSKSGSIFSLWVQEPTFSNSTGVINFEGVVLNPGFSGSGGKIMTINFKVKSAGRANLNFSSGSVLANDGGGTNILDSMGSADYQLSGGQEIPAEPTTGVKPTEAIGVPATPQVFSSTHPDSNKWYNNKNPQFSWILPPDVNGVGVYFSQSPTSNPGPVSDGLFVSKSYENVEDGVWYFHIKMKKSAGWGPIAHFKIQVDTLAPMPFEIKFIDGKETENPTPTAVFYALDSMSGIDYYKIKIGESDFVNLPGEIAGSNPYTLPSQAPGKRNILVQATDKAGNFFVATEEFSIKPLKEPKFTEYPEKLESGAILMIKGESQYPNSEIVVWLQKDKDDPKLFMILSDQAGKFIFTADEKLSDGIYKAWSQVIDKRGAKSLLSEKITIIIEQPKILKIGNQAVTIFSVVVPLVALIILLLGIIWYSWHKFSVFKKKISQETREAEDALHKAIDFLKKDIQKQIKRLGKARLKRQLTDDEEKIIKQFEKDLDEAEKFVKKEIDDIEITTK